jgi:regulatory protein
MSDSRRKRLPRRITAQSLESAALAYLQRFSTSTANLRSVLMRRVLRAAQAHGDDPAQGAALIDSLIARYVRAGLLNDTEYAAARSATLHRRGASTRGIRMRLAAKGVDSDDIDQALETLAEDAPNMDLRGAFNYARRRRLGPWRTANRDASRDRDIAALGRQGYGYEIARRIIDAEDVETLESEVDAGE